MFIWFYGFNTIYGLILDTASRFYVTVLSLLPQQNKLSLNKIVLYNRLTYPNTMPNQPHPTAPHPTPPLCTAVMLFDRHADGPYLELIKKAFSPSHPVIRHNTYEGKKVTRLPATYAILRFDDVCVFMWVCVCLYVCATKFVCVYQVVCVCVCVCICLEWMVLGPRIC